MHQRLTDLEAQVAELVRTVSGLERRLSVLEGSRDAVRTAVPAGKPATAEPAPEEGVVNHLRGVPALLGRTLLVLAGAFLLRAITDAGTVPRNAGVTMGLVYAGIWVFLANRDGAGNRRLSAAFHGVSTSIIGYPLLYEATIRLGVLSPPAAGALLLALTAVALGVAWYRSLHLLGWIVSIGATLTGLALLVSTHAAEIFTAALLLVGLATAWLAYSRHWHGIRWPVAGLVDVAFLQVVFLAASKEGPTSPYGHIKPTVILVLALLLFVAYAATFTIRTLVRARNINPFEVIQTAAVLLVGYGGSIHVARATGIGVGTLGTIGLLLGLVSYAVAFTAVDRRQGRGPNFFFYTSLGLVLLLSGSRLVAADTVFATELGLLGLATAVLGGRFNRISLRSHGVVYTFAAAAVSGLWAATAHAFIAPPATVGGRLTAPALVVLALSILSYAALVITQRGRDSGWPSRIPRFLVAIVGLGGIGALVISLVAPPVMDIAGGSPPATLATVRTFVLCAVCLVTAAAAHWEALVELTWLVYPLLVLCGVKILLEDLPHGQPATLFLAFAACGTALLLAPHLLKQARAARSRGPTKP
ncbi:MAG: hypothetical protein LJE95_15420 [Acidobacteria bacterium]|nr:hypothetical protein [Acidobacteriota bacterium]